MNQKHYLIMNNDTHGKYTQSTNMYSIHSKRTPRARTSTFHVNSVNAKGVPHRTPAVVSRPAIRNIHAFCEIRGECIFPTLAMYFLYMGDNVAC